MLTDFGKDHYLEVILGQVAAPSTYYVALLSSNAVPASVDGTSLATYELSASGYARVSMASSAFGTPSGGVSATTSVVSFGTPTVDWLTVTGFALCDAATAGNVYAWAAFDSPYTVLAGQTVSIGLGGLVITLDGLNDLAS